MISWLGIMFGITALFVQWPKIHHILSVAVEMCDANQNLFASHVTCSFCLEVIFKNSSG